MKNATINDYYPVFLDVDELTSGTTAQQDLASKAGTFIDNNGELKSSTMDAETILVLAKEKKLSELQTLVLLVKNAFEGQMYLIHNLDKEHLLKHGTVLIDWEDQKMLELTESFTDNLEMFQEGLHAQWAKLYTKKMEPNMFSNIITVIVNSQLFRLPVSQLNGLTISFLKDNLIGDEFYASLAPSVSKIVADKMLIEIIDEQYNEKFSDLVQLIESKMSCLTTLQIKQGLVSETGVKNQEDLQNNYHEYLIMERNIPRPSILGRYNNGSRNYLKTVDKSTGKLFREISKLCREIFVRGENDKENDVLNDFFMIASKYWNSNSESIADQIVNYFMLSQIYFRIIIYRSYSGLPVKLKNFHFLDKSWLEKKPIEKINSGLQRKQSWVEVDKLYHQTYFKIKNLADEELAEFHKEFLTKKIESLDKEIKRLDKKINKILNDK